MNTANPRKLYPRCLSRSETVGVNNILVAFDSAYRNDSGRKFLVTKVFDVIPNLMAQLGQSARQSIMDGVSGDPVSPGGVTMSG